MSGRAGRLRSLLPSKRGIVDSSNVGVRFSACRLACVQELQARACTHTHTRTRTLTHTYSHMGRTNRTPPTFPLHLNFSPTVTHFILSMPTPGPTTQHWHRHPLTLSLMCTHMHDRQQMHAHILHSCVTGSRPCGRSLDCHLNLGKTLRRAKCICEVRPTHVSCRTTSRSLEARP